MELWTVATGKLAGRISLTSTVRDLAFSPDGRTLVTVTEDTSVRLWDVPTRQPIAVLSGHTQQVNSAAFIPGGLITASADGTARVWNLNQADQVRALCDALQGPGFTTQWQALSPSPGHDPCS